MHLRPARGADRAALRRILQEGCAPEHQEAALADGATLVAEEQGAVLGFGTVLPNGTLALLSVGKAHRRKGVGATLCAFLEMQYPVDAMTVRTPEAQRRFFQRQGYEAAGKAEGGRITMKKELI